MQATSHCNMSTTLQELQKAPWPRGWVPLVNKAGELYFADRKTKRTSWEDPRLPIVFEHLSKRLPPLWELGLDDNGDVFFVNHSTSRTHWSPPWQGVASRAPTRSQAAAPQQRVQGRCLSLNAGWAACRSPSGEQYFVHAGSKRTTWTDPRIAEHVFGVIIDKLPTGQDVGIDDQGLYFIDHTIRQCTRHCSHSQSSRLLNQPVNTQVSSNVPLRTAREQTLHDCRYLQQYTGIIEDQAQLSITIPGSPSASSGSEVDASTTSNNNSPAARRRRRRRRKKELSENTTEAITGSVSPEVNSKSSQRIAKANQGINAVATTITVLFAAAMKRFLQTASWLSGNVEMQKAQKNETTTTTNNDSEVVNEFPNHHSLSHAGQRHVEDSNHYRFSTEGDHGHPLSSSSYSKAPPPGKYDSGALSWLESMLPQAVNERLWPVRRTAG